MMAEQIRKTRRSSGTKETQASDAPKSDHKSGEELKAEMDALLDDIDEALEGNELLASEFIQKGGE